MKKIVAFIKERSHFLMLVGLALLVVSLLYVFQSNRTGGSRQIEYAVTAIAVTIYIIGRVGAALKRSENKKTPVSQSDEEASSLEKKNEE